MEGFDRAKLGFGRMRKSLIHEDLRMGVNTIS